MALALPACSTSHSTLKEREAYAVTRQQAADIVHGAIAAHMSPDRVHGGAAGSLTSSGYMRFALDTHTVTASAFPVRGADSRGVVRDGYAFQVYGTGTMVTAGTLRTARVYDTVKMRARAAGEILRP